MFKNKGGGGGKGLFNNVKKKLDNLVLENVPNLHLLQDATNAFISFVSSSLISLFSLIIHC